MNIFNKVALQGLKKNRTRTFVTIIGVSLATALFTGIATFAVSLQSYMINGAVAKYGSWYVEFPAADADFVETVEADNRILDTVLLQNIGYAKLGESKNDAKPYLFLSGWNEKAFHTLPLKLISGRLPENSNEVLIPAHLAANGGVKIPVGDIITLEVGNRVEDGSELCQHDSYSAGTETFVQTGQKTYTVVGICRRPAIEEFSSPGYTLITKADDAVSDNYTVCITLKNPYGLPAYVKALENDTYVLNDDVLRFMGLSESKTLTVLFYSVSAVLVMLVVVGSVFLIYNAFNISLNERTHQFGILMSVGATARQLRSSVLFEGLCISLMGIPIGILIGLMGIRFVIALVEKNFANVLYDNVPLVVVVSLPAIVISIIISLITVLISAYIPAKKAANTPVMKCIRQTNEIKAEAKKLKTSRITSRFLGLEETLAIKNFKRNKRRYRSIILSLTFSVILFVSSDTFSSYLNQIAESTNEVVEKFDIVFSSRDMEESQILQLYDQFKNVDGITVSGYQAEASYPIWIDRSQISEHFTDTFGEFMEYNNDNQRMDAMVDVVFVDDDAYRNFLDSLGLSAEEYTGDDDKIIMAGFISGYLYMQDEPMEITIYDESRDKGKTIKATYVGDYPDVLPGEAGDIFRGYSLLLIVPYDMKQQFDALGTATKTTLGMTFQSDSPGKSTSQMRTIIDANGITADYSLYNVYEILEQNRNINFIVDLFAIVFVLMITLIATANVFNTISTNIKLRKKELAMLRSVGMSDRDFNRMMCFECALYGVRTMLWGIPLSLLISGLIYGVVVLGSIADSGVKFIFSWESLGVSIIGVFVIVFITMWYATSQIKKENIIEALRDELT